MNAIAKNIDNDRYRGCISASRSGKIEAWFPATLEEITSHPGGRLWAVRVSNHLYLISLEGRDGW